MQRKDVGNKNTKSEKNGFPVCLRACIVKLRKRAPLLKAMLWSLTISVEASSKR